MKFRALFTISLLLFPGFKAIGQGPVYVDEPLRLKNYTGAPVHFRDLLVISKVMESDEWMEECVDFNIEVDPNTKFSSLTYELVDNNGKMLVGKTTWVFGGREILCFSNNINADDRYFVIRPEFAEDDSTGNAIWESEEHKALVHQFDNLKTIP